MLVPAPENLLVLSTVGGSLVLGSTWPPGAPAGFTVYFPWWIQDPAGPAGLAASNGLSGTMPP